MSATSLIALRHIIRPREEINRPEMAVLSVYRDYGVIPKSSRSDNFNKTPIDLSRYQVVHAGDLVVNKMKAWQGSLAISDHEGIVSPDYLVCSVSHRVHGRFLHYLLRSSPLIGQYMRLAKGIRPAQWRIYWDDLAGIRIELPTRLAQRSIVDFLDAETARIEALIIKKHSLVERLEERWRSVIADGVRELGEIHGWTPLKRLVDCLDGVRIPLSAEERSRRPGPYPYFGASGQIDTVDSFLFDETLVLLGEDGAQLADPSYEIAQVVYGKIWVNNHAHVLRPVSADPDFLAMHLNTFDRPGFITGSTREKLTQEDMNRIPVPRLDLPNQEQEGGKFRDLRASVRVLTQKIVSQIDLLRERRQALITAAVTGELQIPERAAS